MNAAAPTEDILSHKAGSLCNPFAFLPARAASLAGCVHNVRAGLFQKRNAETGNRKESKAECGNRKPERESCRSLRSPSSALRSALSLLSAFRFQTLSGGRNSALAAVSLFAAASVILFGCHPLQSTALTAQRPPVDFLTPNPDIAKAESGNGKPESQQVQETAAALKTALNL